MPGATLHHVRQIMTVASHTLLNIKGRANLFLQEIFARELKLHIILLVKKCLRIRSHNSALSHHVLIANGDCRVEKLVRVLNIFTNHTLVASQFTIVVSELEKQETYAEKNQRDPNDFSYPGARIKHEMKAVQRGVRTKVFHHARSFFLLR